jgi:hypothetical protein
MFSFSLPHFIGRDFVSKGCTKIVKNCKFRVAQQTECEKPAPQGDPRTPKTGGFHNRKNAGIGTGKVAAR